MHSLLEVCILIVAVCLCVCVLQQSRQLCVLGGGTRAYSRKDFFITFFCVRGMEVLPYCKSIVGLHHAIILFDFFEEF